MTAGDFCAIGFQILIYRIAFSSGEQLGQALVAPFASKTRLSGDHEVSTSLARLSLSEAKYVDRGGRYFNQPHVF